MRRFLAGVGKAKLFGKKNGKIFHIADISTLTDSTLNFEVESEEIRGGTGATLYGKYFHDTSLNVTLSDAMWNLDYIALLMGSDNSYFTQANGLYTESFEKVGSIITLSHIPQMLGGICGLKNVIVWIKNKECFSDEEWQIIEIKSGGKIIRTPATLIGKDICVKYFVSMPQARNVKILSNFLPAEVVLILTTKLFSGDPSHVETGKPVGEITVKIPRLSLDGNLDITNTVSSYAPMELKGKALSVAGETCDNNGIYAEVLAIDYYGSTENRLVSIIVDPETIVVGRIPTVWGYYKNGTVAEIPFEDCVYSPIVTEEEGLVGDTLYTVTVGDVSTLFTTGTEFVGNPINFETNDGANPVVGMVLYDSNYTYESRTITTNKNIRFVRGDTVVAINCNDGDDYQEYTSDNAIIVQAGNTSTIIGQ